MIRKNFFSAFIIVAGCLLVYSVGSAKGARPAMTSIEDVAGLPRVLLIGDSISIGYTASVRGLLKGKANVHRPLTNCEHIQKGLDELDKWLGDKKWEVIHFNWGLHDLKYVNENWKKVLPDKGGKQVHPVYVYAKKLEQIVIRLKDTGAKLIFATTTPYPAGCAGRINDDELKYNEAAKKIMKKHGVAVNDLHAAMTARPGDFERNANVHFDRAGSVFLAEQVAKSISAKLNEKRSGREFYVSPDGSDGNDGSKGKPFKTIVRARDAIRSLDKSERKDGVTVYLSGGTYGIDETIVFGLADGGVTWQAIDGQEPVISSGVKVAGWKKLTSFPKGLPDVAKGNVWVADMPDGVEKFLVMFDGDRRLERARGRGFQMPEQKFKKLATRNVAVAEDRHLLQEISFPKGVIKDWDNIEDVEVFYCGVPWTQNVSALESVDVEKSVAVMKYQGNTPPWTTVKPYNPARIENVIDVLDSPGEWCVNTKTRKIYYWPINGVVGDDIIVPTLKEFFRVGGKIDYGGPVDVPVKGVVFRGLTFTHGDRYEWWDGHKGWGIQHDWDKFDHGNALLRFRGAEDCVVDQCRFTNSGNSAIRLDLHAQNITLQNCLIDRVGHVGILLCGYGPGTKDVNKNNRIVNNIIDHCGEVIWHGHAIFVWQSGSNYIANNRIQYVPRKAIGVCGIRGAIFLQGPEIDWDEASNTIRWNELAYKEFSKDGTTQGKILPYLHARDNVIENNYVYRARTKIGDGAAMNVSGAGEGNIMRRNFLYMCLGNGMRCDDWQRGTLFTENLICSGGVVHKGHNDIVNNIFLNTNVRFSLYPGQQLDPGSKMHSNIMYHTRSGIDPYKGRKSDTINTPESCDLKDNLYFAEEGNDKIAEFLKVKHAAGMDGGSVCTDPLFAKAIILKRRLEPGGLELRKDSPAFKLGFKPIDTSKIGLTEEYPGRFLKDVFAEKRGKLVSGNAKVTSSTINQKTSKDLQELVKISDRDSVEFVYESFAEDRPWVVLELDGVYPVNGMNIVAHANDRQNSMRALTVWASVDNKNWAEVWRADPYHIAMGRDWDVKPYEVTEAKYIKIGLRPRSSLQMQKEDDRIKSMKKNVLVLKSVKVFTPIKQGI